MNNKAQFTPGPWVVNTFIVNGQHKLEVLDATGDNACIQANAHLIAAAPAMYEALETVPLPKHNEAIGEFYTRFYTWYEGQVKQALAQAEGKHD